jgi:hypothetical protein
MNLHGEIKVKAILLCIHPDAEQVTKASQPIAHWRDTALGRNSPPEEIAPCVRFILATPSMTEQNIILDGDESLRGRARDISFNPAFAVPK